VRLETLPYMTKVHSLPALKSGTKVQLEVKRVDTLLMELECKFVAVVAEATREVVLDEEENAALEAAEAAANAQSTQPEASAVAQESAPKESETQEG
jgi:exoribonuclease II